VNPARGEALLRVGGEALPLRPTFAALVAAEEELGPLFALVERAAGGGLALSEMVALFWHCRAEAPAALTRERLGEAVAQGWRVLLVVTDKPRALRPLPGETGKRGAIRAEIGDWLARSVHAGRIASVRTAHPRHGGDRALYIILGRATSL